MNLFSIALVFVIAWWLCLFIVLPIGVRNADEAGEEVEAGNEPGAPVSAMIGKKALWAAYGAAGVTLVAWIVITALAP